MKTLKGSFIIVYVIMISCTLSDNKRQADKEQQYNVSSKCNQCHILRGDSISGIAKWPTLARYDSSRVITGLFTKHDTVFEFNKLSQKEIAEILKRLEAENDKSIKPD
ncbi:hypothetical protein KK083_19970 [Fulvivirgaceae bacterium PWU4]|uniref:Cytochrome c domain-containing protein n=1 Tax=Chryseosolibacter histidini TaxID=2782349 RepID=A0AAP2DPI0_9BACT|nr:hypothetical protein [Chryseosolibacter histidini]MBT1699184.1 hypothetical protein [Chryseosolibacter histidini]